MKNPYKGVLLVWGGSIPREGNPAQIFENSLLFYCESNDHGPRPLKPVVVLKVTRKVMGNPMNRVSFSCKMRKTLEMFSGWRTSETNSKCLVPFCTSAIFLLVNFLYPSLTLNKKGNWSRPNGYEWNSS